MKNIVLGGLLSLAGCSLFQVPIDECMHYSTNVQQSYCYASKEVTAARKSIRQSLIDEAITNQQAKKARDILDRADSILDQVERLIIIEKNPEQAQANLLLVRQILLELK